MGLIIIAVFAILTGALGFYAFMDDYRKHAILLFTICALLIFIFSGFIKANMQPVEICDNAYKTEYIHAVQDDKSYYTTISISNYLYYQYYYTDYAGGYSYNTIPVEDTIIYNDGVARVEYYKAQRKWFIFTVQDVAYKLYIPYKQL